MNASSETVQKLSAFAWTIADLLRGDFKQSEYGKVILPFVVLRRLDSLLEGSKEAVLEAEKSLPENADDATRDMILFGAVGGNVKVYNLSRFTFDSLKGQDPGQLHQNLLDYITKFSPNVRDIFLDKFRFTEQLKRLKDGGILWNVFECFCDVDLHPDTISNIEMGYLFEELIRRFSEMSNETAGEHFTPREVIRLIVDLLISNDDAKLTGRGIIRQVYDPACGTGGMLALTEEALKDFNPSIRVELFGQELNDESFGICKSDMLVTGHDPEQIVFGNTLTQDANAEKKFHYMICNPPYGVKWSKYQEPIKAEAENQGFSGRFGAGTPSIDDGQMLFLQHMISKMRDDEDGSRIAIVMNGSSIYKGRAGSSESEIRRWIFENDWVESIVALPEELFYNTGLQTYVWLLTNRKPISSRGKVQLIDASGERFWRFLRKSLGEKRREIPDEARADLTRVYASFLNGDGEEANVSKILNIEEFGYREIRVERPLRQNFQASEKRIARILDQKAFQKLKSRAQRELLARIHALPKSVFKSHSTFVGHLDEALSALDFKITDPLKKAILSALSEKDSSADIVLGKGGQPESDPDLRDHEKIALGEDWKKYLEEEIVPFSEESWIDQSYCDDKDKAVGKVGFEIPFNQYFFSYERPESVSQIDKELRRLRETVLSLLEEVA